MVLVIEVGHNLGQLIEWGLTILGWAVVAWFVAAGIEFYTAHDD